MVSQVHLNDSTTVKQQISFAMRLCQDKEYSQAQSYLQSILTKQQKNAGAWYLLGFIAAQKKQYDSAVETIKEAIKINPEDAALHHNLGNLYLNQKLFTKAVKCYRNAVSLRPEAHQNYHSLGVAYAMQGDIVAANFSYGLTEDKQGNSRKAVAYYQKVIKAQPKHALAYYKLGEINYRLKEFDLAISYYQKTLELHPDNPSILYRLAEVLQKQNKLDDAIDYYKSIIKKFPQHSKSHLQLSFLYHQQNKSDLAFVAYRNAARYQDTVMDYFAPFDSDPFETNRSLDSNYLANKIPLLKAVNKVKTCDTELKTIDTKSDINTSTLASQEIESEDLPIDFPKMLEAKYLEFQYHQNRSLKESTSNLQQTSGNRETITEKILIPIVVDLKSNNSESDIIKLEKTSLETQDNLQDTEDNLFYHLDKELIAQRIFDNDRTFLLTTFIPPEQEYLVPKILKHLKPTLLSFSFYRTPIKQQNIAQSSIEQVLPNTKPNYFASIYQDLHKQQVYQRKYKFSHLLYVEPSCLFGLDWQKIEILQNYCDRQLDFSVTNWLHNVPKSAKVNFNFEEKFLIASSKIQLYRLSKQSLWMWEVWQQAIVEYSQKAQHVQIAPGDESFLDYAWNSILCHVPALKYAWLNPDEPASSWVPIARTLVS